LWTRNNHYLNVVARLAEDVEVEQARSALSVLTGRSAGAYPEFYAEHGYRTQTHTLRRAQTANERLPMMILLTSVGLLLLLTCANVANIQLGRGAARGREIAVRRALGASNDRLIAEQMADALVIAGAGGLCALGLATLGARLMPLYLPASLLRFGTPTLDLRVLGFTLGITLLATLAFGLWPAVRSLVSAGPTTRSASAGVRYSLPSRGLRSALVVGQMALACVLLVGCGMTVRSLFNLIEVDPGFSPEGVLVIDAAPPATVLESPQQVVDYYRAVESELSGMAGVSAAGSLARLPMTGFGNIWSIEIEGRPAASVAESSAAQVQQATPGAFAALDIDLLRGRLFDSRDTAESEPVVVVNESFAREFWQGEEAIGKRFRVFSGDSPFMRVVGVVENLRDGSLDREGRSQWYVPHAQAFQSAYVSPREMRILVRTNLDTPTDMAPAVIDRLHRLNPGVLLVDPVSLPATVASSLSLPRQMALWLAVFAGVALLLAGLGLYGVLSFLVAVRKSEIGIRMALGAAPRQILGRVLAEGLVLCSAGLALGLGLGIALSQLASDFFFEIEPADPQVLGATLVVLLLMGVLAPLAPARRAGRTDPCGALRGD
ncbi:MAG: FtsX-like permease family protein, partial [Acidobacteriota bacterium]